MFCPEPPNPSQATVEPLRLAELGELGEVICVPTADRLGYVFLQELLGVLADRLQQPEGSLRVPEQALVERLRRRVLPPYLLGASSVHPPPRKTAIRAKKPLLVR